MAIFSEEVISCTFHYLKAAISFYFCKNSHIFVANSNQSTSKK